MDTFCQRSRSTGKLIPNPPEISAKKTYPKEYVCCIGCSQMRNMCDTCLPNIERTEYDTNGHQVVT